MATPTLCKLHAMPNAVPVALGCATIGSVGHTTALKEANDTPMKKYTHAMDQQSSQPGNIRSTARDTTKPNDEKVISMGRRPLRSIIGPRSGLSAADVRFSIEVIESASSSAKVNGGLSRYC